MFNDKSRCIMLTRRQIVFLLVSVAFGLAGYRIFLVNIPYSDRKLIEFAAEETAYFSNTNSLGQFHAYGDIGVSVSKTYFLHDLDTLKRFDYESATEPTDSGDEELVYCMEVVIANNTKTAVRVPVYEFELQSRAWRNAVFLELFKEMNEGGEVVVTLGAGEQKAVVLPYALYSFQFSSLEEWNRVKNRPYTLVLSLYPDKYVIRLNDNE